ncbi:MAG: alcohol dehydrogenase catalytic domain-containing protein [Streptosporangiales bacterium]|nr:alcohol dehydrogenase catalytic domain-containing protein [Streptosporangiales bacterium]
MRGLTVVPGRAGTLEISDLPEPVPGPTELLVEGLYLGICGTDREIASGEYGWPPPERERLVLGHESLGRVVQAPPRSTFAPGDLVVGVVRRPDPEPCPACARGEFDMCRNGLYVERGIKQIDGYGSERWVVEEDYAVRLDPSLEQVGVLMEPTTVLAKAWDHIDRIGNRAWYEPRRALITGAGPIGLLAALLARQRGLEVAVIDRIEEGIKPQLVKELGATYHTAPIPEVTASVKPDVIVECTGAAQLIFDAMAHTSVAGIVCLTGVSSAGHAIRVDAGSLNREIVLENDVVFGSVNANLYHYRLAADALAAAGPRWLERMITRTLPLERAEEAFDSDPSDVKVVLDLTAQGR